MKIVHLSDLHIGYNKGKWNCAERAQKIVNAIKSDLLPVKENVVVITGDIVDKGKDRDQIDAATIIVKQLTDFGFSCIAVPGNHDYGSGLSISLTHQSYFKKSFYQDKSEPFPRLDIIDQTAFISLDSLQGEFDLSTSGFDGEDLTGGADGAIGAAQLSSLQEILANEKVKNCTNRVILLHHHPIFKGGGFLALKDADELIKVLENNDIDLLLFGHKHGGDILNGNWGIPRIYDGGSSTGKKMEIPSPIRVFDLSKPPGQYYTILWEGE